MKVVMEGLYACYYCQSFFLNSAAITLCFVEVSRVESDRFSFTGAVLLADPASQAPIAGVCRQDEWSLAAVSEPGVS